MSNYQKLAKNSIILMIANFGSKILTFLLVPFYTHVLSTAEFGTVDIIVTTVSVCVPFVTLSIAEAALRFSMEKYSDKNAVFTNCLFVFCIGYLCFLAILPFAQRVPALKEYLVFFSVLVFIDGLYSITAQFARGSGYVKVYAFGGMLSTIALVTTNVVMLLHLKWGMDGYLCSVVASYFVPTAYYWIRLRLWKSIGSIDRNLMASLIKYSIPMIPNALAWMVMTASDKYILIYFAGSAANGLYVVSQKIPSIINIVSNIFMQSWQLSAVDDDSFEKRTEFYTNVFTYLSTTMIIAASLIILVIKPLYLIWVEQSYYIAWKYTPILIIANIFSCFSGFVGTSYMAMKKTIGNLKTTLIGSTINLVLNFILIPKFGIYAAAGTTLFSFLITLIIRIIDTRDFVSYKINYFKHITGVLIIFAQYCLLFIDIYLPAEILCVVIEILIFKSEIKHAYSIVRHRIMKSMSWR